MNITTILEEEYNNYLRLNNEKNSLEASLRDLSGHNDEESIRRMNEISKRLGDINSELSLYDQKTLINVQNYLKLRNIFNELSRDIKAIEDLSKEGKKPNKKVEFVSLTSPEGRSKQIDKELASDYMKLVEEKIRIKNELNRSFNLIKNKMSMKNNVIKEEVVDDKEIEYVLPEIKGYDDLSIEDKIKETKDRLERIFATGNLPNMGKKILVTYNNTKYEIPEQYKGVFKSTYLELRKLENKLTESKKDSTKVIPVEDLVEEDNLVSNHDIIAINKVFDTSLARDEKMYQQMGIKFDPEKQKRMNELVSMIFGNSNGEEEIRFKEGIKQKIDTTKGYVATTSKKVVSYFKEKTKKVRIGMNSIKKNDKEKREKVSYQIVNRVASFKDNTCQRVNEKKSKFASIKKSTLESIRKPFDSLREKRENFITRKELNEMVVLLREQNKLLIEQNKALTRKLVNNSGFISTAAFIITTAVLITVVIFLVVGFIVFR